MCIAYLNFCDLYALGLAYKCLKTVCLQRIVTFSYGLNKFCLKSYITQKKQKQKKN